MRSFTAHICSFVTLWKVRDQFISSVSRLGQVVQNWNGNLDDLWLKCGGSEVHASFDGAAIAHNDAVFKSFFNSSTSDSTSPAHTFPISAVFPAANDAAIRSWREGSVGEGIRDPCSITAPPYIPLLCAYLTSAASAAVTGAAATQPVVSQLAALAAAAPAEVFRKILSEKFASSSDGGSSSSNVSAANAFAAAAGTAIPQQFSLGSTRILQADHAPLWRDSMGELGAGLLCLQQRRASGTSAADSQAFCDQASNMWSHCGILSNYLNLTASISSNPPSRMRMPAASPEVAVDAWWLPDVEPIATVVAEESMWKSEWPQLTGSAGTNHSWAAAFRCATSECGDPIDFSPWKEEQLVSEACAQLASGRLPSDLAHFGGIGAVAEQLISGTSGRVPLTLIEALFAELDFANPHGTGSESGVVARSELLCDLMCNIGAADGEGKAAGVAINCSNMMPPPLSLQALSYALSLYPPNPILTANTTSTTPPASPSTTRKTPTPAPLRSSLASIDPDVIRAALINRYMIITLRTRIASCLRPVSSSKITQDVRAMAAAAVTLRPDLLLAALALVIHDCPDGVVVVSGLRKLAFDEYVKNKDTKNLVRLLELECSTSVADGDVTQEANRNSSGGVGDALSLCVRFLGKPEDLSDERLDPDVELVLIESVGFVLFRCGASTF